MPAPRRQPAVVTVGTRRRVGHIVPLPSPVGSHSQPRGGSGMRANWRLRVSPSTPLPPRRHHPTAARGAFSIRRWSFVWPAAPPRSRRAGPEGPPSPRRHHSAPPLCRRATTDNGEDPPLEDSCRPGRAASRSNIPPSQKVVREPRPRTLPSVPQTMGEIEYLSRSADRRKNGLLIVCSLSCPHIPAVSVNRRRAVPSESQA